MAKRTIAFLLGFVICVSAASGATVDTSLGYTQKFLGVKDQRFDFKWQPGISLSWSTEYSWAGRSGMSLDFGVHYIWGSNFEGGYGYKGYKGADTALLYTLKKRNPLLLGNISAVPGISVGPILSVSLYQLTEQLFFYPGVRFVLFDLLLFSTDRVSPSMRLQLPVELHFRRDLSYAFSLGINISPGFSFFIDSREEKGE